MASSTRPGQTAPKGRATRSRDDDRSSSLFGPSVQWIVVLVIALAVIGAVLYFARDVRSTIGSGASGTVVIDTETTSDA